MIGTCQGETEVPLSGVLSQWAIGEPRLLGGPLVAVGVSRPQTAVAKGLAHGGEAPRLADLQSSGQRRHLADARNAHQPLHPLR